MRTILSLADDWRFDKSGDIPEALPENWASVRLPHTYNAEDGQDGGNDYYRGDAVYCRTFARPRLEEGGRAVLEITGAAMTADVFINGHHAAHHEGGYSTFRADVTDLIGEENLLCIRVNNGANDRVYPQKADFTFYGGLYREVNLILVPQNHFELVKDGTPGIRVTPVVGLETGAARVTVDTWQSGKGDVTITVAGETKVTKSINGMASAVFTIENVHLWDGTRDPYLYTATAGFGGDEISARFGCRKFEIDAQRGFILNGRPYPLRGVSRHQDRKGIGSALTMREHEEDMAIIREMGANTIRLAHYQHAQAFYDLCDENGMVVWAEIPYITAHMPAGRPNTLDQMRELITQCYNHPCIAVWGLSNEITASGKVTDDLLENHRELQALCKRMDATRPTTMAHAFMLETDSPLIPIADIASYNLYFGWYLGELAQNDGFFDEYHAKYPERVISFSEYGADANPQYQTGRPDKGDYTEQYQCVYHEHVLRCIEERPYLWATHVWNMFDFAADGRDEGGKHGENQKGLVTFDRKLKKDAFYLYKAHWSNEPFVHICARRYIDRCEDVTQIRVYTNQKSVTLVRDGIEVETKTGRHVFTFDVPLTGEHSIQARCGGVFDVITVRKVAKPNPDYRMMGGEVVNWFDADNIDPNCFSIRDMLGTLKAHPQAGAIVGRMMAAARASRGDVANATAGNANLERMLAGMTLQSLLKQAGPAIKPEQIESLNAALQKIRKS